MANSATDELKHQYHLTWWALMLRGLLGLAVGVFVLLRPLDSIAAFALVIALWALFAGMVDVVQAFHVRPALAHWWVALLGGLVGVGFGVAALAYYPSLALAFAVLWVGLWLLVTGCIAVYSSYRLKHLGLHWGWPAAFGALSVVAGVLAVLVPGITLAAIMGLIAAFAILSGIVQIGGALKLRSLVGL
jgi:uncharacterized membrane protein HdeD (DUF308 family)